MIALILTCFVACHGAGEVGDAPAWRADAPNTCETSAGSPTYSCPPVEWRARGLGDVGASMRSERRGIEIGAGAMPLVGVDLPAMRRSRACLSLATPKCALGSSLACGARGPPKNLPGTNRRAACSFSL